MRKEEIRLTIILIFYAALKTQKCTYYKYYVNSKLTFGCNICVVHIISAGSNFRKVSYVGLNYLNFDISWESKILKIFWWKNICTLRRNQVMEIPIINYL